jgi:hypothetical protein
MADVDHDDRADILFVNLVASLFKSKSRASFWGSK